MTDNQPNPSYQDILDKYAESINSKEDHQIPEEKIKPEPELEPINPPEPILTPEEEEVVKSQPPIEPEEAPLNPPEEVINPPQIEAPPAPEAITPPPVTEAIIPPSPQIELPPDASEITPKKENHFFKYLFFISLIIFIIVLVLVVISFLNSQKPISSSREIPKNNISPTSMPADFCELNDQKYLIGATFTADDGCNTCTCGEDLTVTCTTNTCDLTPTTPATSSPSAKPSTSTLKSQVEDWNTYTKSSENLSWDKCEGEPTISVSLKDTVSKNPTYTKTIDGVYLAYSLKSNFTAEDIDKFVMCQAGGEYPIKIIEDKILWVHACSTGIAPDNPKCDDTLSAIKKLYGYVK